MSEEQKPKMRLEIGHVLFLDIVGYSKLLTSEQSAQLQKLKEIVRGTEQFRSADAEGKLLRLPTGDGGALVFRTRPEAPVECAQEISRALKAHHELRLRMGIHSGPVNEVSDLNEQLNMAGAGINFAQRVMDCGDAGHILLSKRVADDIVDHPEWRPHLRDLGECEVKHGVRVHLFNLYGEDFGNSAVPGKVQSAARLAHKASRKPWFIAAMVMAVAVMATGIVFQLVGRDRWARRDERPSGPSLTVADKSIAVLPFENLSSDKENAYFADGIQDEILTRLANIGDLKVISRTSTKRFKSAPDNVREIAQQLGVAHLLEGSVQKSNDQVRVNVQLINARNDSHVWAETYDRTLNDIFAVEAEIATRIAEMLQAKLTGSVKLLLASRPTENSEAHQLYLRGKYYHARGTEADYRQAIDYYKGAVRLDGNYASAYSALATAWINLARKFLGGSDARRAYEEARIATDTALSLAPNMADAHATRGLLFESTDFNWKEAELAYRRALELEPNDSGARASLAGLLASLGHPDQAVELIKQALTSDPLYASYYNRLSVCLSGLGRLDEAEQAINRAISLEPGHADFYTQLTTVAIQRGDAKAALSAADKEIIEGGWREIALALAQQISGDPTAAAAALNTLIEHQPDDAAYQIAQAYALRNEPDKVFEWLDRAWNNRDAGIGQLLYDPFLSRYKDDPRFAAFCRKVRLPEPTP
jgi:TolB-like protein/Tfp pilus assembly protein PilF/class 3 adenylate cyclase